MRKLFILFFALCYPAIVFAAAPISGYYNNPQGNKVVYPSCQAACDGAFSTLPAGDRPYYGNGAVCNSAGNSCTTKANGYYWPILRAPGCADGSQVKPDGTCADPVPEGPKCDVPAGTQQTFTIYSGKSAIGKDTSDPGTDPNPGFPQTSPTCGLVPGSLGLDECYSKPNADGKTQNFYCTYRGTSNGANAPIGTPPADSGAAGTPPAPAKDTGPADAQGNCPKGTVQAGIDLGGTPICMGTGTNPGGNASKPTPTTTTTKGTDAAGNSTETTTTTTKNADGSTTTTTTTAITGADGSKSVSGSTTTSAASNGANGQQDKPADDFCKLHPELTICKNSSVAGSCGAISCMGDAIQCATLRAAAAMQCAQEADTKEIKASGFKTLGDQIMSGNDPMKGQIDSMLKGSTIDMSRPNIDQNGFLGGGSCIANKSFTVMGQTVTVEFDKICNDIQPIRAVIMLLSFIAAYSIVVRTILTM